MDKETADKVRGMVRRVTLKNVKDDGETQTASVEVSDGIWRDDVEIMQPYGFSSHVPEDGALAMVLAVGGDEGDLIVMPSSNPSKRLGKLASGEVGIYNEHGDTFVMTAGGDIKASAGASFSIAVGGVKLTVTAGGFAFTGGQITHNGKNIGDTHVHKGVVEGGNLTKEPN